LKVLVLGGAGAMGMVTVRDLAESREVSEVVIGDVSLNKARKVAEWTGQEKVTFQSIDVSNRKSLVSAMKEVDVVANAAPYHLNLEVTKAAIEAGKNLTDLGGVYYMTLKQLELNGEAKKAGVTVVLGCGLAPGIADVLAKFGSEKMDRVREVHVWYGDVNLEPAKYKWTFRTVLEEYTRGPVVYREGEFKRLPPFSGKQLVKFPKPVGERRCCYGLYSGVATLPFTIGKGVKNVDCAMSYTEEDEQRIKVLTEMGLTSTEPVAVNGASVSPREFLLRLAPPPDVKVRDAASVLVEVTGESGGEDAKCIYSLVQSYNESYGVSATAYLTGVPLSVAAQMLARGEIDKKGVFPPETAIPAKRFFAELARRGIKIRETTQRTRTL